MTLDLSGPALLNAAGAFLFLLIGVFVLAVGSRTRLGLRLGALSTSFGLLFVVQNLLLPDTVPAALVWMVLGVATTVGGLAVAFNVADPLPPRSVRPLQAFVAASALALVLTVSAGIERAVRTGSAPFPGPPVIVAAAVGAIQAGTVALLAVILACALRCRADRDADGRVRRSLALLALAFGTFAYFVVTSVYVPSSSDGPDLRPYTIGTAAIAALAVVALAAFVPGPRTPDGRLAARLVVALALAGVAGAALQLAPGAIGRGFGAYGIARTIGAAALLLAILRYDLLGVPLPRLAVSRGPLAAGALAILFVVAQVAQNFLAAEYGLLMGGLIAGAFLFAASPIQRAIEGGRRDRAVASATVPDDAALEAYRAAVRAALADGAMTRDEEAHLADVAHHLRLSPRDALRVRRDVESEGGTARASGR